MRIRFKFIVFCIVGSLATLSDFLFFNLFYFLKLGFVGSITLAWIISMTFNFTINRNFTFSANGISIKGQIPRWLTLYFVAFLLRLFIGKGVLYYLGDTPLNANIAFLSGLAISVPLSFFGSLFWVFRKNL